MDSGLTGNKTAFRSPLTADIAVNEGGDRSPAISSESARVGAFELTGSPSNPKRWALTSSLKRTEWPTVLLFLGVYLFWVIALTLIAVLGPMHLISLGLWPALVYTTTLHASLQHEALHGHPFRDARLNTLLASVPLCPFIPYLRFKRLHLRHHRNEMLTDPYDDPESFYVANKDFVELSTVLRSLLKFNNTLFGRLTVGPALSLMAFYRDELRLYRRVPTRRKQLVVAWGSHLVGVIVVGSALSAFGISILLYALAIAYPAMSLLMLRTFAEHQAADEVGKRTAIVEASPFFALLYLNNNLHFVHHEFPNAPWYELPMLYRRHYQRVLEENGNYLIPGYKTLFNRFFLTGKEQVDHPIMRR